MKIRNEKRSEFFSDVNIPDEKKTLKEKEVVVCFKLNPSMIIGEGSSNVCIALDSSISIMEMFGKGGLGFFDAKPNYMQIVTRAIGKILMQVSSEDMMHVFYWALGRKGDKLELAGQFTEEQITQAQISGPKVERWGHGTKLLPLLRYICEYLVKDMDFTMGVIITDGFIEDEDECVQYCMNVAQDIKDGKIKALKLVLIGIGSAVNIEQLNRFDDMFEGTDFEDDVDLFSSGTAASIQNEDEILDILFGELMTDDIIVAPSGKIFDEWGNEVVSYTDGLPGKIRFTLPINATHFIMDVQGNKIKQTVVEN